MPKPYTYPTLFNEAFQINISKLKEWDYLNANQIKSGTITWSRSGNQSNSISITANTRSDQPYIELDYLYRSEPRNYKLQLVSVPSNLGIGNIWYFLCPQTNKRCRKLYSIDGYFLHREAFKGCLYECQTQSKSDRQLRNAIGVYFKIDDLYSQIYQKHFKQYYAGKPTKKYNRIKKEIEKLNFNLF